VLFPKPNSCIPFYILLKVTTQSKYSINAFWIVFSLRKCKIKEWTFTTSPKIDILTPSGC
jgi:hypothetical protein